jgi:hypothetical protein
MSVALSGVLTELFMVFLSFLRQMME